MRIRTILGFSCANLGSWLCCANPLIARNDLRKPRPRVAVFYVSPRFQLADVLPAKTASCRSWFASRKVLLYATQLGVSEQGATPSFFTELAYAVLATRSCLSYGKQCASLRRPNKGLCLREATARSGLADLARHTKFVCAILGLSRRARIQGLRKKILGWCESALCA